MLSMFPSPLEVTGVSYLIIKKLPAGPKNVSVPSRGEWGSYNLIGLMKIKNVVRFRTLKLAGVSCIGKRSVYV